MNTIMSYNHYIGIPKSLVSCNECSNYRGLSICKNCQGTFRTPVPLSELLTIAYGATFKHRYYHIEDLEKDIAKMRNGR